MTHLVIVLVTHLVHMHQVLRPVCPTMLHWKFVMSLQCFSIKQVLGTDRTPPALLLGHHAQL